jgi:hypothetical protein
MKTLFRWIAIAFALPASCTSGHFASKLKESCSDFEGYSQPNCSPFSENMLWLLSLALIFAFVWSLDKHLKQRRQMRPSRNDGRD